MEAWFGIAARCGAPPAVLIRRQAEMAKAVESPDMAKRFESGGGRVLRMSAAQTEAFVKAEIKKWSALICVTGTSAE